MIKIETEEQFLDLIQNNDLVVLDFFATWCGPCKMLTPQLEKLSEKYKKVVFIKIDVDDFNDIAESHQISAMPTILFYKSGNLLTENVIGGQIGKIEEIIKKYL
jgi:thioredoxin 1